MIEGGAVRNVYPDNSNIQAIIVDIDNKKIGEEYIHTIEWFDTQFDDEVIKDLMGNTIRTILMRRVDSFL